MNKLNSEEIYTFDEPKFIKAALKMWKNMHMSFEKSNCFNYSRKEH